MNTRQLAKLGVPQDLLASAQRAVERAAQSGTRRGKEIRQQMTEVLERPGDFTADDAFGPFAKDLLAASAPQKPLEPLVPGLKYRTWGSDIDVAAHIQMEQACTLPMAVGAALMPDAHVGYGLPIGGVLALEGAVCPYGVGVDIACRMKLSILDMPIETLDAKRGQYEDALERGTRFGIGCVHSPPRDHPVMDEDWQVSRVTREHKDKARKQLGTSGSGNHFVEFGELTLEEPDAELGLAAGKYTALMSHSGSRGVGAAVCDTYSSIARRQLPKAHADVGRLAWLSLDTEEGQGYWAAMNLMGQYAAANHDVIHKLISKLLGARIVSGVENHHNFAWLEKHQGRDVVVHRKGATPAGPGVLGVIPGSMADPAYIVRGKGNAESLNSAAHGAGRRMSRTQAKSQYRWGAVQKDLAKKGITVLSAGADEVPYVYKNIHEVMAAQADLVTPIARFDPRIVKMCGDGSQAED